MRRIWPFGVNNNRIKISLRSRGINLKKGIVKNTWWYLNSFSYKYKSENHQKWIYHVHSLRSWLMNTDVYISAFVSRFVYPVPEIFVRGRRHVDSLKRATFRFGFERFLILGWKRANVATVNSPEIRCK